MIGVTSDATDRGVDLVDACALGAGRDGVEIRDRQARRNSWRASALLSNV
jgi:hypothetical protein